MKKVTQTFYITEDGAKFESESLALAHEETLNTKHFESRDAMVDFFKQTEDWKKWEDSSLGLKETNPVELRNELHELGNILTEKYPKVHIGKSKSAVHIGNTIWLHYEPKIIIDYFKNYSKVNLPEKSVLKIYHLAYSNNHSYGLADTLDEFDRYIEAIEIAFEKSQL